MKTLKLFLVCLPIFLGYPSLTTAATYTVDQSGAGDFTTIQAAVDQAAAVESTGSVRGSAYFTHASDIVSIYSGLPSLQVGMLISIDNTNWYEIAQILDEQTVQITRPYDGNNLFGNYKAVDVANINIKPGTYQETVDMQGVHFVRFQGDVTGTRESVIIQPPYIPGNSADVIAFPDVQNYGALYFKNLTVRNISSGSILMSRDTTPSNMNLTLENVHFDAQCCDVVYGPYGHVLIEDSSLEGQNDVLGSSFKSLTIRRSQLMSLRTYTVVNSGKAVFVQLLYNSLIEDSLILAKSGSGTAVALYGTNGNTLTIRNSILMADGGTGPITALNLFYGGTSSPASMVYLDGSRLLARSQGTATDIQMRAADSATLKCTEYATVTGGGTPTVLSCP